MLFAVILTGVGTGAAEPIKKAPMSALQSYGRLPMSFEPNVGQSEKQVKFLSRGAGYALYLTGRESVLLLRNPSTTQVGGKADHTGGPPHQRQMKVDNGTPSVVRMKYLGAASDPQISGLGLLEGESHYLKGATTATGAVDAPRYGKVEYRDLYPGIDLVYYGGGEGERARLEHDFVVKPGADPAVIRLGFEGVEKIELGAEGNLVLKLSGGGELVQHAPFIYQQESEGVRTPVEGSYVLLPASASGEQSATLPEVGFRVASHDPSKTLFIDPVISYSTYLGGSDYDFGWSIAVDSSNCAYVVGWTYSSDFPVVASNQAASAGGADIFVAKFSALGNALTYCTYIGGSGDDFATGIAVGSTGVAYVTGYTNSTDFPTTTGALSTVNAGLHDAFVLELSATGKSLIYSTYLGGAGEDYATAIAVDAAGAAYVTGYTASTAFPTTTPYQAANAGSNDAFLVELNATGTALVYGTYLGGTGDDYATAVALDSTGVAYVAGYTTSTNFPMVGSSYQTANAGLTDGFLATFSTAGAAVYTTYIGGASDDLINGVAVVADTAAPNHVCAYVTGVTWSSAFPTKTSLVGGTPYQTVYEGNGDAFVSKIDPSSAGAAGLVYSTYLGYDDYDAGNGIAVRHETLDRRIEFEDNVFRLDSKVH